MDAERRFSIESLLANVDNARVDGDRDARIESIAFDSRNVATGGLFVALRGGYSDGHDFLAEARRLGAVAALVEPETNEEFTCGFQSVVRVKNTRRALA
ncbi:MAG TPA: Mur ligase domain-containing protein, partial [Thermomicrobiales bacterium]|nr:Mur ligase domain-containing protein [Thermomicrobiales bacterium]